MAVETCQTESEGLITGFIADNKEEEGASGKFKEVLDKLPSKTKFYVLLGMFQLADLLKDKTSNEQARIIDWLVGMPVFQRMVLVFKVIFGIELSFQDTRMVVSRKLEWCLKCGSKVIKAARRVYRRQSREFLRDLGIPEVWPWFKEFIHVQRWKCVTPECGATVGSLKKCDLPYSINSVWTMDWCFTAYLNSCASYRAIAIIARKIGRPLSPAFVWHGIQQLGQQFMEHVIHLRRYLSGFFGADECYPKTIEGERGIIGIIDQETRLIINLAISKADSGKFSTDSVREFLEKVQKLSPRFHALITDLLNLYPSAIKDLPFYLHHIGCLVHIKRKLREKQEEGLKNIDRHSNKEKHAAWIRQLEAIHVIIVDIFHSPDAKTALEKLEAILILEGRFASNPGLASTFKFIRNHQEILVQTLHSWPFLINNNPIERFFGHIRHKLKIVRGWKADETLLLYTMALAIYRNFLELQKQDAVVVSYWTGQELATGELTFAEYLQECLPGARVGSNNPLPRHRPIQWEEILIPCS